MEINKEEIGHAIDNMKSGKRAGRDGLPIDLHQKTKISCSYHFWKCFWRHFRKAVFLPSMYSVL